MRKPIAFIVTIAVSIGAIAVPGVGSQEVYAATPQETAKQSLLSAVAYYSEYEDWELNNWEELLAVYGASLVEGSSVHLKEWALPKPPVVAELKGNFPRLVDALIKGNEATVKTAVAALTQAAISGGAVFSSYADEQAQCMLALEIASSAGINITGYDSKGAAFYLISMQDEATGGFSGQYDGTLKTVDTAGYVALAIAPFAAEVEFTIAVDSLIGFLGSKQLNNGGFPYEYEGGSFGDFSWPGGSYESANSTALAVWGLSALQSKIVSESTEADISTILIEALPALTKWQNSDGSFNNGGSSQFDSFTTRQVMIALYALATGKDLFSEIRLNNEELVSTSVRIESDKHLPVETTIATATTDTLANATTLAWGKYSSNLLNTSDYKYIYNEQDATISSSISTNDGRLLVVSETVTTRSAFTFNTTTSALNKAVTVKVNDSETGHPIPEVIITVNGMPAGCDPTTYKLLATDSEGKLTIPAENFLIVGDYQITTSHAGISKDLCVITIEAGTPESKTVSVRIEGIDRNILYEKAVNVSTTGTKTLTAMDAIQQALKDNGIEADISYGFINSIDGIANGYFGNVGGYDYWNFYKNGKASDLGVANTVIESGDSILLFYGTWTTMLPNVSTEFIEGLLQVHVASEYGKIEGATVTLYNEDSEVRGSGETDIAGLVSFNNIASDIYFLQVEKYHQTVSAGGLYLPVIVRLEPSYVVLAASHTIEAGATSLDLTGISSITPQAVFVQKEATQPSIRITTDVPLPKITVYSENANSVRLTIPQGTTVTASSVDWDGTIFLPTTTTVALTGKNVSSAIIIGSSDHELTFDQPVRLLLPGAGSKKVGFIDNAGTFTEITQSLTSDAVYTVAQELAATGKDVGKYISSNDMVVWTKHFTTFVTYADATSDNSGSTAKTATLRVYGYNGTSSTTMLGSTTLEIGNSETPITLLAKSGLSYENRGGYIASIEGLEERDYGSDSGWKYSVNGTFPSSGASSYILKHGDAVVWRYVTALNEGETTGGAVVTTGNAVKLLPITEDEIKSALVRFIDIDPSKWYGTAIGNLVARRILSGRSETIFAPMDTITRAEFAMILAKAAGVDLTVTRTNGFNDVAAGAWFAPAVAWAKEAGIVSGYKNSDGTYSFRPSDVISRQDMAVMIQNFLPQQNSEGLATTKEAVAFQDEAEIASYAKTAVASMQKAGIISGVQRGQDTFFLPRNTATRAEAAVMIWQALQNK
jgi:hypothetical protein